MWKPLYDWFVQFFSGLSWGQFIASQPSDAGTASRLRNIFRNDLYPVAGILFLIISAVGVVIYYRVYNRKGGSGYRYKLKYWVLFLGASVLICFCLTFGITHYYTQSFNELNPGKFNLALSCANAIYCIIIFTILSIIVKRASVANRTPF